MPKENGVDTFDFETAFAAAGGWRAKIQKFEAGDVIYQGGHRPRHVYLVTDGLVVLNRENPYNDPKNTNTNVDMTTDLIRPGNIFGFDKLTDAQGYLDNAIAQRATTVIKIPYRRFEKKVTRQDIFPQVWNSLAQATIRSEIHGTLLTTGNAQYKAAGALTDFMDSDRVVRATQDEIARRAGIHRVSLNRKVGRFEQKGLLQRTSERGKQVITIFFPTALNPFGRVPTR